ncbi:pumilio-like protein [Vairimorpha necatrix]|uniref:Pumilio-like protein n=1 Tax=Vairimorpha necatrix TaxID=6039 RepID=A0AAX4J8H0_9MICR
MSNGKYNKTPNINKGNSSILNKLNIKEQRPCSAPPVDKLFVSDDVELIDIQYSSYYSKNSKDDVRIPPPDIHIKGKIWLSEYDEIINKAFSSDLYSFKSKGDSLLEKIDNDNPESKSKEYKGTSRTTTPIGDISILDPNTFNNLLSINSSPNNSIKNQIYKKELDTTENMFLSDMFLFYSDQQKSDALLTKPLTNNPVCLKEFCVYMSKDQEGSRLIQNRIDLSTEEEIDWFFSQIEDSIYDLSSNLFGNYVIQKILPKLTESQKFTVFSEFKNRIYDLSLHPYGCRVIQKLMDCFECIDFVVEEIRENIFHLIEDQNGNHVIQKYIEKSDDKNLVIDVFKKDSVFLSTHRYGCRVIQRLLEFCSESDVKRILKILIGNLENLVNDQYGNYVIQHMLTVSNDEERNAVISQIINDCYNLSKFKFSSNVIEQCIVISNKEQKDRFLCKFLEVVGGKPRIFNMSTDMYGNYVVQKFYDSVDNASKEKLKKVLKPFIKDLKKVNFARHILYKINT